MGRKAEPPEAERSGGRARTGGSQAEEAKTEERKPATKQEKKGHRGLDLRLAWTLEQSLFMAKWLF